MKWFPVPIVSRELLAAARGKGVYRTRFLVSLSGLLVIGWLALISAAGVPVADQGKIIFNVIAIGALVFCLVEGARITSDCLSHEKRDGTLPLLFLTDLRGRHVIAGKMVSHAINTSYGMLAVFPVLALVFLMGGVGWDQLLRVILVLCNGLFLSVAAGLFVSAISQDERRALFAALVTIGTLTVMPYVIYHGLNLRGAGYTILEFSPWHTFDMGRSPEFTRNPIISESFYRSALFVHGLAWLFLILAGILTPVFANERPQSKRRQQLSEICRAISLGSSSTRRRYRKKLLDANAYTWLAIRNRGKIINVWSFLAAMTVLWLIAWWHFPDFVTDWFAVLLLGGFLHGFIKIWIAGEVCVRSFEDRRAGALELLLTTPLSPLQMARGQWAALRRQFLKPALAIIAAEIFLLFIVGNYGLSVRMDRTALFTVFGLLIAAFAMDAVTLWWVSQWNALISMTSNRALSRSILQILVLPWVLFLVFYFSAMLWIQFGLQRPFRIEPAALAWGWFFISLLVDAYFGCTARLKYLRLLRMIAAEPGRRFNLSTALEQSAEKAPTSKRRIRRPVLATATAALALLFLFLVYRHYTLDKGIDSKLATLQQKGIPVSIEQLRSEYAAKNSPNLQAVHANVEKIVRAIPITWRSMSDEERIEAFKAVAAEPWSDHRCYRCSAAANGQLRVNEFILFASGASSVARYEEDLEVLLDGLLKMSLATPNYSFSMMNMPAASFRTLDHLAKLLQRSDTETATLLRLAEGYRLLEGRVDDDHRLCLLAPYLSSWSMDRMSPIQTLAMAGMRRNTFTDIASTTAWSFSRLIGGEKARQLAEIDILSQQIDFLKLPGLDRHDQMVMTEINRQSGASPFRPYFPRLSSMVLIESEMLASARLARIALALEIHRRETGDFPATLEELKDLPAATLLNPYTHEPITLQFFRHYSSENGDKVTGYKLSAPGEPATRGVELRVWL